MAEPDRNAATRRAAVFVRALHAAGLRQVFASPGSRSTPLTLAFAAHPGIRTTMVVDERVAAFAALGAGKAAGIPAAFLCTSGTAGAHALPAVLEARQAETPLLVLTADRPPLHREVGASQTLDQQRLFGGAPRFVFEVGEGYDTPADDRRLSLLAFQAVREAARGGAAHLNFAYRKPLEPTADFLAGLAAFYAAPPDTGLAQGLPTGVSTYHLPPCARPVVVAGPLQHRRGYGALMADLGARGIPLLLEPGAHDGTAYPAGSVVPFTDAAVAALRPDLILRFGHTPVAKAWERLSASGIPQIHFWDGDQLQDPDAMPLTLVTHPAGQLRITWDGRFEYGDRSTHTPSASPSEVFTDGAVYRTLLPRLTESDLFVSNSFPIRDLARHWLSELSERGLRVHVNRGAAGIDGITSSAAGVALAAGTDVVLFTGDVAFLHDLNGLLLHGALRNRLTVVVVNNGGGTIFRMLPIAELPEWHIPYFETPTTVDFGTICAGFGVRFVRVSTSRELERAYADRPGGPGITVIECRTDADASMKERGF